MTEAHKYAKQVLGNKIVTSNWVKLACQRFTDDLKRKDVSFDKDVANQVLAFTKTLRLWEGEWAGQPVKLYPWQCFIIQNLFAWKKKDGTRKYRTIYVQVARKNGKTTSADIITACHVFLKGENTPQVLVGANNEDQAKICTNSLGQMLRISPAFRQRIKDERIRLYEYKGRIFNISYREGIKNALISAISRDPRTKDGFNPSLGIIDEYHEAKDDSLLNVIESGQGARREPLLVVITTAGFNKDGVCYSKMRKMSVDMLEGRVKDDSHFAMIYEQDPEDDWKNKKTWIKSNPMIPFIPSILTTLEKRKNRAINEGGTKEVDFKTKNLNMWTDAAEVWIPHEKVIENNHNGELQGSVYVGFDLAKGEDLNALAIMDENLNVKVHYWIPSEKLENNSDYVDYLKYSQDPNANMKIQDGNVIDFMELAEDIAEILEPYNVSSIGYDSRYASHAVIPVLVRAGYEDVLTPVGQGFNLSPATIQLEQWLLQGKMNLMENPVLYWNLGNVVLAKGDKGDVFPSKKKSIQKIDGVSALCTAIEEYLQINAAEEPIEPKVILL